MGSRKKTKTEAGTAQRRKALEAANKAKKKD
jgi:hypothetical protein